MECLGQCQDGRAGIEPLWRRWAVPEFHILWAWDPGPLLRWGLSTLRMVPVLLDLWKSTAKWSA